MNVRDHEDRGLGYGGVVILVEKLSFGSVSRAVSAFFVLFFLSGLSVLAGAGTGDFLVFSANC